MSALDMLVGVCRIVRGPEHRPEADKFAQQIYDQVRREVLDDLARSGTGLAELLDLASTGDQNGEPVLVRGEVLDLWHTIRGAALLQAAEQLQRDAENAVRTPVKFALDWASRRVHKMIINPRGSDHGEAQGDEGSRGVGTGTAPDA
jgi:hypothetical protein